MSENTNSRKVTIASEILSKDGVDISGVDYSEDKAWVIALNSKNAKEISTSLKSKFRVTVKGTDVFIESYKTGFKTLIESNKPTPEVV